MSGFERQRMFSALILLVIALVRRGRLAAGGALAPRIADRGNCRVLLGVGWVLVEIGFWLIGGAR